ncbi:MAG: DUF5687 family protein [Bacillota bacterium]
MKSLIDHQWKSFWRSPDKGQKLFSVITVSFLLFIVACYALLAGLFLPEALKKLLPDKSPVLLINQALLYYIILSFLVRWVFQEIPAQEVDYYRMLPVKRITLVVLLLIKSAFNVFNFFALLFFTGFTFNGVIKEYSFFTSVSWLISVLSLEFANSYLVFYLQKKMSLKSGLIIPLISGLILLIAFEIITSKGLHNLSAAVAGTLLSVPAFCILPVLLLSAMYFLNYYFLQNHFYAEDLQKNKKANNKVFRSYRSFERYGELGSYIALELKLIFRNRRTRSLFYYSLLFLLYPALTYRSYLGGSGIENMKNLFNIYLWSILAPSLAMLSYGQNIYAWDGSYFDLICSRVTNIKKYIYAKYCVMVIAALLSFLLLTPYALIFGKEIFWFNAAGTLYSIGLNSLILLIMGPLNKKRFELNTGMMSQQGRDGWTQFLKGLPVIIPMALIYLIVKLTGCTQYLFHVIAFLGLVAFLLKNIAINIAVDQFQKRRYKMAMGFRQS